MCLAAAAHVFSLGLLSVWKQAPLMKTNLSTTCISALMVLKHLSYHFWAKKCDKCPSISETRVSLWNGKMSVYNLLFETNFILSFNPNKQLTQELFANRNTSSAQQK